MALSRLDINGLYPPGFVRKKTWAWNAQMHKDRTASDHAVTALGDESDIRTMCNAVAKKVGPNGHLRR